MSNKKYDLTRLRKTYPLRRQRPRFLEGGDGSSAEVEILTFNNTDVASYTFKKSYQSIPVCVISPEDENVNVFITSLTNLQIQISSSAPFTGKVHLHIYKDDESWKMIQKGKTTITAGNDTVQVNYAKSFSSTPVVNISCKENVNVYLIEATNTSVQPWINWSSESLNPSSVTVLP